jgi:hypothetical protein
MPLTNLLALNLPEIGTGASKWLTLCQNGTEPRAGMKLSLDTL